MTITIDCPSHPFYRTPWRVRDRTAVAPLLRQDDHCHRQACVRHVDGTRSCTCPCKGCEHRRREDELFVHDGDLGGL